MYLSNLILILMCLIQIVFADPERMPEFQESSYGYTGSRDPFADLSPEVAEAKVSALFAKMDNNSDGFISRPELVKWMLLSFENLDREDAADRLHEFDVNKDNKITMEEFFSRSYNVKVEDIDKPPVDEHDVYVNNLLKVDKQRFELADQDGDGALELREYMAFLHPHNYAHMVQFELGRVLNNYDSNRDGAISEDEFIDSDSTDSTMKAFEKKQFTRLDDNGDGRLDVEEIKKWIWPGIQSTAEAEVDHLFRQSDTNNDGRLTKGEILTSHRTWAGSQATNYGRHLTDEL